MGSQKRQIICNYLRLNIHKLPLAKKKLIQISIFLLIGLLVGLHHLQSFAISPAKLNSPISPIITSPAFTTSTAKIHPLPVKLSQWQDISNSGDYFPQIQATNVGYLVWSKFPVNVYIESPGNLNQSQAQKWVQTVEQAVQEWDKYLPLQIVSNSELANIKIIRKAPPLQGNPPRARSAEATYKLYSQDNFLRHKFTILLAPSQTGKYLLAASRHELGHALGIWGHSSSQTDALYFSQVVNPPQISSRDVNTLKRIYQQPTRLGWKMES